MADERCYTQKGRAGSHTGRDGRSAWRSHGLLLHSTLTAYHSPPSYTTTLLSNYDTKLLISLGTTSSLMCKPLQFHYGTKSYQLSYLDVTRLIQSLYPPVSNSELHLTIGERSHLSLLFSYSPVSTTHRLSMRVTHYFDNDILPRRFLFWPWYLFSSQALADQKFAVHPVRSSVASKSAN